MKEECGESKLVGKIERSQIERRRERLVNTQLLNVKRSRREGNAEPLIFMTESYKQQLVERGLVV